jgi:hypothetical protein
MHIEDNMKEYYGVQNNGYTVVVQEQTPEEPAPSTTFYVNFNFEEPAANTQFDYAVGYANYSAHQSSPQTRYAKH